MTWFNNLPKISKTVIVVAVTVLVLFIFFVVYKKIKKVSENKNSVEVVKKVDDEISLELKKGNKISFPESVFLSTANLIEKNLDGCERFTTEIDTIKKIISTVKKQIDWLFLQKSFGVRKISDCGTFGTIKNPYDLATLLKEQLDSAGYFSFEIDGNKISGSTSNSYSILSDYFKKINVEV